jgi:hypothetical protein
MIRVLLDFVKTAFTVLLTPPVSMSALRAAIDAYSAAVTAAFDGGSKAIAHRNALGDELRNTLRLLASYVEITCNGDMTTFLSSGFQAKAGTRARNTGSVSESIRKIAHGASGEFLVTFVPVSDAVAYELRWAPASGGSPGPWESVPIAQATRGASLAGLVPGTPYVFQVRVVKRSGVSPWSEPVTRMCA